MKPAAAVAAAATGAAVGIAAYRQLSVLADRVKGQEMLRHAEQEMTDWRLHNADHALVHLARGTSRLVAVLARLQAVNYADAAWVLDMPPDEVEEFLAGVIGDV